MIKKVMFYPLWEIEKLENLLCDFELNGWRLKSVMCSCIFEFVESRSRNVNYIVTYTMAKDWNACMYEYERILLTDCYANRIQTKFTGINLFRITKQEQEFGDLVNYRRKYFRHVLLYRMLLSGYFFISGIGLFIAAILQKTMGIIELLSGANLLFSAFFSRKICLVI